jgi:hypothetical protein
VDPENLAVLAAATANRERVGFRYESADGTESRRMVEPHGLVSAGRRWYLVAYDTGREDWRTFRVDRAGVIAGGGMRADGPGRLGVFLEHDPADFGLRPTRVNSPSGSRMRTGLSDALATDEADDSYDLSWMSDLPLDDLRAIKMLRQLLEHETDAIDRHYMHSHLQTLLYRSRDVFASALDEYDQACQQHDAEMDSTRAAFMAKWGQVPVLELYRQMAIRQQRAKNFEQALWWAERGIAITRPTVLGWKPWRTWRIGRLLSA